MLSKFHKYFKSVINEDKDGFYLYDAFAVVLFIFKAIVKLMNALTQSKGKQKDNRDEARGTQVNQRSSQASIPLVYGQQKVGINQAYLGVSGSDNKTLHVIGYLSEGECHGLVTDPAPYNNKGILIYFDDKYIVDYTSTSKATYEFKSGASDQTYISGLPDGWTDNLRYISYLYFKLYYDENYYQNIPNITAVIYGIKVYDPRSETTAWSDNPALIVYDMIIRSAQRGGMGIAAARVDTASVIDAANYCDTKGWTCNVCFNNKDEVVIDRIQRVLSTFRAELIYSEGLFKIKYRDLNYESPVINITEDDIVEGSLFVTDTSIQDTPNAIRAKWVDPNNKYEVSEYVFEDSNAVESDGDYREVEVDFTTVTNMTQLQQLCNYELERRRKGIHIMFTGHARCMPIEPFDIITITSESEGWVEKYFRVLDVRVGEDNNVSISAIAEYTALYDDLYNLSDYQSYETTLPSPYSEIPGVTTVSQTEELYVVRNRTYTRWNIIFEKPDSTVYPWWDYAEIEISIGDDENYKYVTKSSGGGFTIDPAQEGQTYYCRIRSVNIWGAKQTDLQCYIISRLILGKTAPPPECNPLSLSASGDTINVLAVDLDVEDIVGYEVRVGENWESGLYIGLWPTSMIRLSGWKPGTFTFWVAAKSNNGEYSVTKASGQVTVLYPANYVDLAFSPITFDFTSGTFTNADRYYNTELSEYVLRCTHSSGLVGSWLSAEYDMTDIITVRLWGDFVTLFSSSATTWESLPGTTWDDLSGMGTKWYELSSEIAAGRISAILYYGDSSGNLTNQINFFEITAPEITARYIQVYVQLTDPASDAFLYLRELNLTAAYWGA